MSATYKRPQGRGFDCRGAGGSGCPQGNQAHTETGLCHLCADRRAELGQCARFIRRKERFCQNRPNGPSGRFCRNHDLTERELPDPDTVVVPDDAAELFDQHPPGLTVEDAWTIVSDDVEQVAREVASRWPSVTDITADDLRQEVWGELLVAPDWLRAIAGQPTKTQRRAMLRAKAEYIAAVVTEAWDVSRRKVTYSVDEVRALLNAGLMSLEPPTRPTLCYADYAWALGKMSDGKRNTLAACFVLGETIHSTTKTRAIDELVRWMNKAGRARQDHIADDWASPMPGRRTAKGNSHGVALARDPSWQPDPVATLVTWEPAMRTRVAKTHTTKG